MNFPDNPIEVKFLQYLNLLFLRNHILLTFQRFYIIWSIWRKALPAKIIFISFWTLGFQTRWFFKLTPSPNCLLDAQSIKCISPHDECRENWMQLCITHKWSWIVHKHFMKKLIKVLLSDGWWYASSIMRFALNL